MRSSAERDECPVCWWEDVGWKREFVGSGARQTVRCGLQLQEQGEKSPLTHGRVQLAFANYTWSPCCRGESRVPAEPVGTAGRGRGWPVGWDVVGVIAWVYEILKWQRWLSESRRSSKIEHRTRGAGGGEHECEGENEPKRKRMPRASPHHPNYNEFNLRPHPIQIPNDLSSCSSLDSWRRKVKKIKQCFIRDSEISAGICKARLLTLLSTQAVL